MFLALEKLNLERSALRKAPVCPRQLLGKFSFSFSLCYIDFRGKYPVEDLSFVRNQTSVVRVKQRQFFVGLIDHGSWVVAQQVGQVCVGEGIHTSVLGQTGFLLLRNHGFVCEREVGSRVFGGREKRLHHFLGEGMLRIRIVAIILLDNRGVPAYIWGSIFAVRKIPVTTGDRSL